MRTCDPTEESSMKKPDLSLKSTGPHGEVWGYDPSSQKWSVEHQGKKSTSINRDSLNDKLASWMKDNGASQSREIPMLALKVERSELVAEAVTVRATWDSDKNEAVVEKYRTSKEGSGWKTWRADELQLVDPFFMPADIEALITEALVAQSIQDRADDTKKKIAAAWADTLVDTTELVELNEGNLVQADEKAMAQTTSRTRQNSARSIPQGITPISVEHDVDLEGWTVADGQWTKGDVRVRLRADDLRGPNFVVEARGLAGNAEFERVYRTEDGVAAIRIAQATHQVLSQSQGSLALWRGSANWAKGSLVDYSWPAKVDLLGVAVLKKSSTSPLYHRAEDSVLVLEKTQKRNDHAQPCWDWAINHASSYSTPDRYWHRDASNPALDLVGELDNHIKQRLPERNFSTSINKALAKQTPETLRQAWGRLDDGEEAYTTEQLQARWNRLEERLKKLAAHSEAVSEATQAFAEVEAKANEALAVKPPSKPRGPKA